MQKHQSIYLSCPQLLHEYHVSKCSMDGYWNFNIIVHSFVSYRLVSQRGQGLQIKCYLTLIVNTNAYVFTITLLIGLSPQCELNIKQEL